MTEQISVELGNVPDTLDRGEFVIPTLRIRNDGGNPITVSSRLNLFEGDVLVWCTEPSGERIQLRGVLMIDSFPRETEIAPGQQLESGLFLSYTSAGFTFDTPGSYQLHVEYDPSSGQGMIASTPVQIQIVEPTTDKIRKLAELTMDDEVGRAIALSSLDTISSTAGDQLEALVTQAPETTEGMVAQLVLSTIANEVDADDTSLQRIFTDQDPVTIAHWITAIAAPAATDDSLTKTFLSYLEEQTDMPGNEDARSILQSKPISSGNGS